ncbi:MAG: RlpA-like double-psi beta-barrel domain-containing protein [Verrucomicrobiales bacterium]|nr:RlpA-like double-psi beta-barrel domain-containing protein [Verrucomicrobiales bacterium]
MTSRLSLICFVFLCCGPLSVEAEVSATGYLSMYSDQYQGRPTASGELYEVRALTAAHATLPLGTMVRVANFETGRMVDVRINDRKREDSTLVNISRAAANHIGLEKGRLAQGSMMILSNAPAFQPRSAVTAPTTVQHSVVPAPGVVDAPAKKKFTPFKGLKRDPMLEAVNDPHKAKQLEAETAVGAPVKRGLFGKAKPVQYGIPAAQYDPMSPVQAGTTGIGGSPAGVAPSDLIPLNAGSQIQSVPARQNAPAQPTTQVSVYRAQFGAFRKSSNAYEMNESLVRSGVPTTVLRSNANALFLVVTQGGFSTADEAQRWISYEANRRGWRERPLVIR